MGDGRGAIWRKLVTAARHPRLVGAFLLSRSLLSRVTGLTEREFRWARRAYAAATALAPLRISSRTLGRLARELTAERRFLEHMDAKLGDRWVAQVAHPVEIYLLVRATAPKVVVETGVASGVSTSFILQALQSLGDGRLFSIDLPAPGLEPGWLVPEGLRGCWALSLGRSSEKLGPLLRETGEIDMFLHDSEHSYDNMMSEYETAWEFLRPSGYLLSDDVDWNSAFSDFCKSRHREPLVLSGRFGIVRK